MEGPVGLSPQEERGTGALERWDAQRHAGGHVCRATGTNNKQQTNNHLGVILSFGGGGGGVDSTTAVYIAFKHLFNIIYEVW